jgi:starch synthase
LAKTGGLADMVSSLSRTLAQLGHDVKICLPAYRQTLELLEGRTFLRSLKVYQHRFEIFEAQLSPEGPSVLLLDCPELFDRPGDPYRDENGVEFADNGWRFGCFSKAVAQLITQGIGFTQGIAHWHPDVVHLHDWHSGLVPAFLRQQRPDGTNARTLFTIHNFSFHGVFERQLFDDLKLPASWWHQDHLEFYDRFSFMKAALKYSDAISTVSPGYAEEIATPEFGCGLEGVIIDERQKLTGIVNGIDTEEWDPRTDLHLSRRYDAKYVTSGKKANKAAMQEYLGLPVRDCPLVIFIGRFAEQKGPDLILAARGELAHLPIQLVVLGCGEKPLEQAFSQWAREASDQVAALIEVSEKMAHWLTAAADVQLMPSRFEPCGLSQLYAQRYGTLPVAHNTGGLADTIVDATPDNLKGGTATGFLFHEARVEDMMEGLNRALAVLAKDSVTARMRKAAMVRDFSWTASAQSYLDLYRQISIGNILESPARKLLKKAL